MLIDCPECQKRFSDWAKACPACDWPVPPKASLPPLPAEAQDIWTQPIRIKWPVALGATTLALLVFFANFHLVWIQNMPRPIPRISLSLSEPISNLDEIAGMPWIAATSKYPLTVRALQKAGLLESDEARQTRIENEIRAKAAQEQQRIMAELKDKQRELMKQWGY